MAKPVRCLHCGRSKVSKLGGDLTCSPDCRKAWAARRTAAEAALRSNGFTQYPEISNLWAKDGVHLSIDQVIREGIETALARHSDATAEPHR
jgi:hypothetical protein